MAIKHKKTKGELAFDITNYTLMAIIMFVTIYPIWYVLIVSLNDGSDFLKGGVYMFPRKFSFLNYVEVFNTANLVRAFVVTVSRTIIGVVTHILFTGLFAFGFYRKGLVFKKLYWTICIIPMFIGGGTIPYFLLLSDLHLTDTFWVYIIPWLFSFWDVLVLTSFFAGIPDSLSEAARIDGMSEFGLFFKIIFPLSMPVFAALALFNGVGQWNSFFDSLLYNSGTNDYITLQHLVVLMLKEAEKQTMSDSPGVGGDRTTSVGIQYASIIVSTVPILLVYPFLQRYFVYGVMTGAVKE